MLIAARVDVFSANSQRLTPLVAAKRTKLGDVVSLIYAYTQLHMQQKQLFRHIAMGHFDELREMLKHGAPHELNDVEVLQSKLKKLRAEQETVAAGIEEIEDDTFEAEAHFKAFSDVVLDKEKGAKALQAAAAKLSSQKQDFDVAIIPYRKKQLRALQEIRDNHVAEVQRIYAPPPLLLKTFTALLMLFGVQPRQVKDRRDVGRAFVDDWWGPAREHLSKHDFVRTVQLFNFAKVSDEVIAQIRDQFVAPNGAQIPEPHNSDSEDEEDDATARKKLLTEFDRQLQQKAKPPPVPKGLPAPPPKPKTNEVNDRNGDGGNQIENADPPTTPLKDEAAHESVWGYRAGMDGYPLVEALQQYLSYVCKHRECELKKRAIDVQVATLKSEQNQIMASLWPEHAAYKRAEFKYIMLKERYDELTKRRRAVEFAMDRTSKRFEISLLLNSRTATGHTELSFASMYNNSSIVHLLYKFGAALNYEDCVVNAAAVVIQTLFRHYSWKCHRKPWTIRNSQRYRLQETLTFRRISNLYKRFEFLRETGRVPIIDAFNNGSLNTVDTLISRKANLFCTSYTFPSRPAPMSVPRKIRKSEEFLLAWHDPKTHPASRGKIAALHEHTKVLSLELRELRKIRISQRNRHKAILDTLHSKVVASATTFKAKKTQAQNTRIELEKYRKSKFELVLDKKAQMQLEEDLKQREDAVRELEADAREAKKGLKAAKQVFRQTRSEQTVLEKEATANEKAKRKEIRKHEASLEMRIKQLEPYTILTAAKTAVERHGATGFVVQQGWVDRGPYMQSYELAKEIWDKADAERQNRLTVLRGMKEVHRRGVLVRKLNKQLSEAILANEYDTVTKLIDDGAIADYEPPHGYTALIMAAERDVKCHNKDGDIIQAVCALLDREEHQAQVGRESRKLGFTPLTRAAHKGKTSAMEQLLRRSANPNYVTRYGVTAGTTALIVAARNGKAGSVRLLLEWGADPELKDALGESAIGAARKMNFTTACRELCYHSMNFLGPIQAAFKVAETEMFCQWGCGKILSAGEIEEHDHEECGKALVPCPNGCDRKDIWRSKLGEHMDSYCDKREVKCKFCQTVLVADQLQWHRAEECPFRMVTCLMCDAEMQQRHKKQHDEQLCPFRIIRCVACGMLHMFNRKKLDCEETVVRCIHGCGREMRRKWIGDHETKACPKRKIPCKWNCGQDVQADMYIHHTENECERRLVACDWKCGNDIPVNELENHKLTRCKRRFIWCPAGCGMKIRACDGKVHLRDECANREQKCRLGCNKVFPAKDIDTHERKKCQFRMVPCGNGCGEEIQARHLAQHKISECQRRLVPCELGCDMSVPADELDDHHRFGQTPFISVSCVH